MTGAPDGITLLNSQSTAGHVQSFGRIYNVGSWESKESENITPLERN
jgi:hypothetical protein